MNQQIINPAIFAYTLWVKFEDRRNLLPLILFCIAPLSMLVITAMIPHPTLTPEAQKSIAGMMGAYFSSTFVNVLVCYIFISDGPAGRKIVAESDSLALTFTRPLTRFSYVLSKYCAGLIGCTVTLSIGLLLTCVVGLCVGINQIDISPLAFATILCNAASWAALVVFLHSAPPVVSALSYLFLNGAGGMGGIFTRADNLPNEYMEYLKVACLFIYKWFGDILPQTVNLGDMFSAASFDMYEAAIYFSNISLLLLFATFAMAKGNFHMAQTNAVASSGESGQLSDVGGTSTLKIPTWFIAVVLVLISVRVYAKLTQMAAAPGKGVEWIALDQLDKVPKPEAGGKDLVLYEFTAAWCPPCQKRERIEFRSSKIIKQINTNFVPVRVDLTTRSQTERPEVKQICEKFDVSSIPRCVITLRSGEFVADDHYIFDMDFSGFLNRVRKDAQVVRAELDFARGDYKAAMAKLDADLIAGKTGLGASNISQYLMCHHLLLVLKREGEIDLMMKNALKKTLDERKLNGDSENSEYVKKLETLNDYLLGKTTDAQLLQTARYDGDRANFYLAIGLKDIREGHKEKAIKDLHQSSIYSAKSYLGDRLAEFLTREME